MLEVVGRIMSQWQGPKACPRKRLSKHALRNALLPLITLIGLSVPGLIGGSVILESVFGIPGMGQLFFMSVMTRDYPMVILYSNNRRHADSVWKSLC